MRLDRGKQVRYGFVVCVFSIDQHGETAPAIRKSGLLCIRIGKLATFDSTGRLI